MCGPGSGRYGRIPCSTCKESGQITEAQAAMIEQARMLGRDRVDRRMTIREEAARLGCHYAEWSRIEHGREPETEAGQKALRIRLEELGRM